MADDIKALCERLRQIAQMPIMPHLANQCDKAATAIESLTAERDGWRFDIESMPTKGRFEVLQRYQKAFRHQPNETSVIDPYTGRMFKPVAWRPSRDGEPK